MFCLVRCFACLSGVGSVRKSISLTIVHLRRLSHLREASPDRLDRFRRFLDSLIFCLLSFCLGLVPLYNNVLSLRLLFLMRMMFIFCLFISSFLLLGLLCVLVCECVCFSSSYVSLIVYKFSPPLPRFFFVLIFSISSFFTNDCYHKHFLGFY